MAIFTILSFLVVAIIVLLVIWFLRKKIADPEQSESSIFWIYLLLALLTLCSLATVNNYVLADPHVYKNTHYHAFEQMGYSFRDSLFLVNKTTDLENNNKSLWDDKNGIVSLQAADSGEVKLLIDKLDEPFYVRDRKPLRKVAEEEPVFHLVNAISDFELKEGDVLRLAWGPDSMPAASDSSRSQADSSNSSFIELQFKHYKQDSTLYYIRSSLTSDTLVSDFTSYLLQGFALSDIILQTNGFEPNQQLEKILRDIDGSILARKKLLKSTYKPDYRNLATTPLYFFPGPKFFGQQESSVVLSINGKVCPVQQLNQRYEQTFSDHISFFSGLGFRKSPIMALSPAPLKRSKGAKYWLDFDAPIRFHLNQEAEIGTPINHFITSRNKEVSDKRFEGGYLFDNFSAEDHAFHISAKLNYVPGSSRDSAYFNVLDYNVLKKKGSIIGHDSTFLAGQPIVLETSATDNEFLWRFQMRDFRAEAPLQPYWFYVFIGFFWALLIFQLYMKREHAAFSPLELALYTVFFAFVIVKLILLWRMYTFPPIEKANFFNNMTQGSHLFWTLAPSFGFMVLAGIYGYWRKRDEELEIPGWEDYMYATYSTKSNFSLGHFLAFLALVGGCLALSLRFFNIAMPLALFFIGNWWMKGLKAEEFKNVKLSDWKHEAGELWTFLKSLVKGVSPVVSMLVGVMLLAGLGYSIFRLSQIELPTFDEKWLSLPIAVGVVLLWYGLKAAYNQFAGFQSFVHALRLQAIGQWLYTNLRIAQFVAWFNKHDSNRILRMKFVIDASATILLLALDTGFGIIFLMFYLLHQIIGGMLLEEGWFSGISKLGQQVRKHNLWKAASIALLAGFIILIFAQNTIISKGLAWAEQYSDLAQQKSYIKYRAAIQDPKQNISELIIKNDFQSPEVRQILNASHCQWFINKYISKPQKKIASQDSLSEAHADPYFHLRAHFDQGASYTTQTTDLVISRYFIGEHSEGGVICLIVLLLGLGWIYVSCFYTHDQTGNINSHSFAFSSILFLLFSIAFFVWLTATNRFTFFGQDFPFISLTSKFSTLFFLFILSALLLNNASSKLQVNTPVYPSNRWTSIIRKHGSFVMGVTLLFFAIVVVKPSDTFEGEAGKAHYNVNGVINYTNKKLSNIDNLFKKYQLGQAKDSLAILSLEEVLEKFENEEKAALQEIGISQPQGEDDEGNASFFSSAWTYFMEDQSNKLDPNALVHIRKRNNLYRFAINRNYFFVRGAQDEEDMWPGKIYGAEVALDYGLFDFEKKLFVSKDDKGDEVKKNILGTDLPEGINGISVLYLGKSWFPNNKGGFLVFDEGVKGSYTIYSDSVNINSNSASELNNIYRLEEGDYLFLYDNKSGSRPKLVRKYELFQEGEKLLARHIWLNGKLKFHYPLGKKFLWSYHFAELMKAYASADTLGNWGEKDSLRLSIDYDLTSKVYDIIESFDSPLKESDRKKFKTFADNLDQPKDLIDASGKPIFLRKKAFNSKMAYYFLASQDKKYAENIAFLNNKVTTKYRKRIRKIGSLSDAQQIQVIKEVVTNYIKGDVDFSISTIDGNGRIRLMVDYKQEYPINPNDIDEFYAYLRQIYSESTIRLEKDILGNKNLLRIDPGPGSSVKPIVYSAILSQSNLDFEHLKIEYDPKGYVDYGVEQQVEEGKRRMQSFGALRFKDKRNWKLDVNNYRSGLKPVEYLERSNNIYHALMIYLGSYPVDSLNSNNFERVLIPRKGPKSKQFPPIKYGTANRRLQLNPMFPPIRQGVKNPLGIKNSALAEGLFLNYNLPRQSSELWQKISVSKSLTILRSYATDTTDFRTDFEHRLFTFGDTSSKGLSFWSLPERSMFIQLEREHSIRNGLIQPSLGAMPITLTPLKIVDMGARMVTQNRNFKLTFIDSTQSPPAHVPFRGLDSAQVSDRYKSLIFKGMKGVISSSQGTGRALQSLAKELEEQELYLYAKTGTMDVEGEKNRRRKHLLVFISNKRLENLEPSDIPQLKYYCTLISFHSVNVYGSEKEGNKFKGWLIAKDYIETIIDSKTFKEYMFTDE